MGYEINQDATNRQRESGSYLASALLDVFGPVSRTPFDIDRCREKDAELEGLGVKWCTAKTASISVETIKEIVKYWDFFFWTEKVSYGVDD